jgi:phospholipase C
LAAGTILQSVVLALILGVPSGPVLGSAAASRPSGSGIPTISTFAKNINHIVIVMMENHAFDNYFGTYCPSKGTYCSERANGIPSGTCLPKNVSLPRGACVTPFPLTRNNWSIQAPLPHSQASSLKAYNNGSMNGFFQAEGSGIFPFGYYGAKAAPILWDLAEEYGLGDNFFSSTLSYSLPNHWHLVAGQAPAEVQGNAINTHTPGKAANRTLYLGQANATPSIEDLLATTPVNWKWYDHPIASNYSAAIKSTTPNGPTGTALLLWNPMAA